MPTDTKNYNFNFDEEAIKIVALLIIGCALFLLLRIDPKNDVITLILTALTSFVVGLAVNPVKKNTNEK